MKPVNVFSKSYFLYVACLIFCFLWINIPKGHAKNTINVLILNSYHREFSWTDNQVDAARKVLDNQFNSLELFVEYMDTKRIYSRAYLDSLYTVYRLKYQDVSLDAVITTDDNALKFAINNSGTLFNNAPVSFCGINDDKKIRSGDNSKFTGVVENLDITATINLALKLHQGTRNIFVLTDITPTGQGQLKDIQTKAGKYRELNFTYLKSRNFTHTELFQKIQTLPDNSIVLLAVWLRDKNSEYLSPEKGGPLISSHSNAPVYGIIDMYLGKGIIGGKLLNSSSHGRIAAQKAVRMIQGENPSNIPVMYKSVNPYMFDYDQLRRWNIDRSRLPENSIILNLPFDFYRQYKLIIYLTTGIVSFLILTVALLSINIMRRKKAESELLKSEEKFRNIFDLSPQAIALTRIDNGKLVTANQKFCELTQYTAEEVIGKSPVDIGFYSGENRQSFVNELTTEGEVRGLKMSFRVKDGSEIIALMFARIIKLAEEQLILTIFHDITVQQKLEAKIQQTQKMESICTRF